MSFYRMKTLISKDIRLSPRSPLLLYVIIMPVLITFFMQVVLLTLFESRPRLGIVDLGESGITAGMRDREGIDLTLAASEPELLKLVENHNVDAGFVLEEGFDAAVRRGERPEFKFYLSGESLASNRIMLAFTALDQIREVEMRTPPVDFVLNRPGEGEVLPIGRRLVPSVLMFVLIGVGIFFPASMIVGEREHLTLSAILVTPVKMSEVLLSKAMIGFVLVIVMSYLTLAMNGALGGGPLGLLVSIAVAAVVCIEIGLIYGTMVKDAKALYTLVKSLNVFLVGPVIFYLFPDWPQWIAKIFPTYWIIDPIFRISIRGASLSDIWGHLAVALGISAVLFLPIRFLGRRLETTIGTT
jgi:ABC-2 type transport system permease protein